MNGQTAKFSVNFDSVYLYHPLPVNCTAMASDRIVEARGLVDRLCSLLGRDSLCIVESPSSIRGKLSSTPGVSTCRYEGETLVIPTIGEFMLGCLAISHLRLNQP